MSRGTYSLSTRLPLQHAAGLSIPHVHLGVYMMSGREAKSAVKYALAAGYRGIDSAQMYRNEKECGQAIRDFLADPKLNTEGLSREDIFYTSKLASNSDYDTVRKSIKKSVDTCGLGYIDLFLLHSPYGGKTARLSSWKAVVDAVAAGEIRIGGVSNFGVRHLQELEASATKQPAVNQIEVHPFNTQQNITDFCTNKGIVVEAYAPLVRALKMQHPVIVELSKKYNASPAQVLIRWSLQKGFVPLPKSVSQSRIEANANFGFFDIEADDMKRMDGLDEFLVTDWSPVDAP